MKVNYYFLLPFLLFQFAQISAQTCTDSIEVDNHFSGLDSVIGYNYIQSSSLLESTADVRFLANRSILLTNGFNVQIGATFRGEIGCEVISTLNNPISNSVALNLYPNPTKGTVKVELPEIKDLGTLKVFAIDGSLVLHQAFAQPTSSTLIDLTGFPSGIYLLFVETSKNVYQAKIVKRE